MKRKLYLVSLPCMFSFAKWLLQFQIGELANTLTSKMEFLGIDKKAISNFQLLLLQTEVDKAFCHFFDFFNVTFA